MAQAQRARWAKARQEEHAAPGSKTNRNSPKAAKKPQRTMSAAARRKIAAFQKAKWAKIRGQQQKKAA